MAYVDRYTYFHFLVAFLLFFFRLVSSFSTMSSGFVTALVCIWQIRDVDSCLLSTGQSVGEV